MEAVYPEQEASGIGPRVSRASPPEDWDDTGVPEGEQLIEQTRDVMKEKLEQARFLELEGMYSEALMLYEELGRMDDVDRMIMKDLGQNR